MPEGTQEQRNAKIAAVAHHAATLSLLDGTAGVPKQAARALKAENAKALSNLVADNVAVNSMIKAGTSVNFTPVLEQKDLNGEIGHKVAQQLDWKAGTPQENQTAADAFAKVAAGLYRKYGTVPKGMLTSVREGLMSRNTDTQSLTKRIVNTIDPQQAGSLFDVFFKDDDRALVALRSLMTSVTPTGQTDIHDSNQIQAAEYYGDPKNFASIFDVDVEGTKDEIKRDTEDSLFDGLAEAAQGGTWFWQDGMEFLSLIHI